MCDGKLREKMEIIKEMITMDRPAESHEYMRDHLTWSLEELKSYRNKLGLAGEQPALVPPDS